MKRFLTSLVLLAGFALVSAPAHAQNEFGLRVGATIDPDQFHFGFHMRPPQLSASVRIRPSFEVGVGDNFTIGALNLDLTYEFYEGEVRPWVGAGPGLTLVNRDRPNRGDDTTFEAGLNLVGGLDWGPGYRYTIEGRAGIGDLPNLKFTFGWTF